MARHIATGIDIGTYQVKVVVAEHVRGDDKKFPKIIGTGFASSRGLRHGYIINSSDIARCIYTAVQQAEKTAGIRIKKAFLSVGGVGLEELHSKAEVVISRADNEVTDLDIDKVLAESEKKVEQKLLNKKILHSIPLRYKIDGSEILGRPQNMRGTKLEIETLFITSLEQHLNDLIAAVEDAGVAVEDVMASPLAGSLVTLTRAQKMAGCVLANIGAETVSIVIFENNVPISLKVLPIGSTDITNDIALGLKISLDEAEQLKLGTIIGMDYPKKKLDDIIVARLKDIFELIDIHLKKIGKNELLPAGIILTGGGSSIATIEDLALASLKLPSKIATLNVLDLPRGHIKDASWAVSYGLCIWGFTAEEEPIGLQFAKKTGGNITAFVKQFLP